MDRRTVLAGTAGGLLVVAAAPGTAQATTKTNPVADARPTRAAGAARTSAITQGTTLVHASLHNHTTMSDGDGDAANAFASMRNAGFDVGALTDHATLFAIEGLSSSEWRRTLQLADAADVPGAFTAIRGFEWTQPLLGHINVYFSGEYADLSRAAGVGDLYNWLQRSNGVGVFNHPGREQVRFENFKFRPEAREQMVGMELFNRNEDYLFEGWSSGLSSPLVAALNAGWRTGITGVPDEHGTNWGVPTDKGRTGLWVAEHSRGGVLEAMRARRFFATRIAGLRLDATANGVRMGSNVPLARGDVRFAVDLAAGADWTGRRVNIQVLRPGSRAPQVLAVIETTVGRVTEFTVPLNVADGNWVVLRVSDPTRANAMPGPSGHAANDWGVAYTSPWWLIP